MSKKISIVGAGLVGSLLTCYLAQKGNEVTIYERRPDFRKQGFLGGRSINLALSTRGWSALERVGVADTIKDIAIPMNGRLIHNLDGSTAYQPYGKDGQAIYSVSRGQLNIELTKAAEKFDNVKFAFDEKCVKIDFKRNNILFQNTETQELHSEEQDLIFGADGAFSKVRYSMQKTPRFNYSQHYLTHGYKELCIPANADGTHQIDTNALHIWPRGHFMLIALPNLDGSFTCTLFAPFEGKDSFENIKTEEDVKAYFNEYFADAIELMPTLVEDYFDNPTSSLVTVKCDPWMSGNTMLIGDASHAIVPFYGQGMNSGFEDCRVLDDLMIKHSDNWDAIFEEFNELRVPDANAISDLALQNFIEMRDLVGDPMFLIRKKIEKKLAESPNHNFMPLYSMVTFSNIRYSEALAQGKKQSQLLDEIMRLDNIEERWDSDEVMNFASQRIPEVLG